jgi:Brp/Blh family beta-carotene 15,15'-monooxygenase
LALFLFIGYSCWHFGEADGKQWGFSSIISFLWGITVLLYILTSHAPETNSITNSIADITFSWKFPEWIFLPFFLFSIFKKQYSLTITILWLLISSHIPLLLAFGIYFIGQHSITSWGHIKDHIKQSNIAIWTKALPFHAGAWLMLLIFFILRPQTSLSETDIFGYWGTFFIFISCISFPHSITMYRLYRKNRTI